MKIRGERECQSCGTRWSYYETGSVNCPSCGSVRSVGRGERLEHTDGPATLDLATVRAAVDEEPLGEIARRAADAADEYVRTAGFVHAGQLQTLPETYLLAAELRRVGRSVSRRMHPEEEAKLYFLSLLGDDESEHRPPPTEVPAAFEGDRGLAVAASVEAYVSDLRTVVDREEITDVVSAIRARCKRIEALDGEVDPAEAERLVDAARDLYAYLDADDEQALARARDRLG